MKFILSKTCSKCRQFKKFLPASVEVLDVEKLSQDFIKTLKHSSLPILIKDDGQQICLTAISLETFKQMLNK